MQLTLITATYNRPSLLSLIALPSLLTQSDSNFEWVVINDGEDPLTRDIITHLAAPFRITYRELPHPPDGFGLCHARNLGIEAASGELISYLDDDNAIAPTFIEETKRFFLSHPTLRCSMTQQWRRRDVIRPGHPTQQGKPFISPPTPCPVSSLILQRSLFDSNGFAHYRRDAPCWNPDHKVFADYDYFLSCLTVWGRDSFRLHPSILVNYIQRSDGVIGRSHYGEWAMELEDVITRHQDNLTSDEMLVLKGLVKQWQQASTEGKRPGGFVVRE